ncbi:CocE/NonD family hydrolase [Streptomyces sp. NPDC059455]|uniref:CocE/NonD family hydrolase n=1 Tax=Streptomyces sp. NPDC059455 TaxID=3346837 RepID=UPI00368E9230
MWPGCSRVPTPRTGAPQGYAVCNPDIRGIAESEGDSVLWGRREGREAHDLIEWLGVQEWCNGRVAMSGTSCLAASQWFSAMARLR